MKTQLGPGPSDRPVLDQNPPMAWAQRLGLSTWGETQASGRGAPSAQVWWNLGLSSVQHNQTNAANKRKKNNQNYIYFLNVTGSLLAQPDKGNRKEKMSEECWNIEWEEMSWMRWSTSGGNIRTWTSPPTSAHAGLKKQSHHPVVCCCHLLFTSRRPSHHK